MRSFSLLPALLLLSITSHAQLLQPEWGSYFGGAAEDWGDAVAVRTDGFIALSGRTASPEGIAFNAAQETFAGGNFDAYAALFNDQGLLQWATYLGGPGQDYASGVAVDGSGRVFIGGHTDSEESISFNAQQGTYGGGFSDGFLAGYSPEGTLLWSTYIGGPDLDAVTGVAASNDGDIYVVGNTRSTSGIATADGNQSFFGGGNSDAFLAKYDASGTLLWSTYIGGTNVDYGDAVHVGADGMVYVCGSTQSLGGIQWGASHQGGLGGGRDGFLMKFNPDGVRQWGTYYGGPGFDQALGCAADAQGFVYLSGSTTSATNIASNGHQNELSSGFDGFLVRFNASGARQWGTYYGGPNYDESRGVAVEAAGTILLVGQSGSPTGIATPDSFQPTSAGGSEGYVARFAANGTRLWASYVGGPQGDGLFEVATHPDGWAMVSGNTMSSSGLTTPGVHQPVYGGGGDGFLIKLSDDISTGITDASSAEGPALHFDPSMETAWLFPSTPARFELFDAQGRLMRGSVNTDRISLVGLPAGLYVVRALSATTGQPLIRRVVKP